MNRLDRWALAVAGLATTIGLLGHYSVANGYYMDQIGPGEGPAWAIGWSVATYGPLAAAVVLWRRSKGARLPWLHHLLLLPCMWLLLAGGERLMLSAITDPDLDAMIGGPVLPATVAFFLGAGGYMAAMIVRQFQAPPTHGHLT